MTKLTVTDHLTSRFENARIVVWHDAEGNYIEGVETLAPADVVTVRVENNEFGLKHRVLREERDMKFLLYRSGSIPGGANNWLLDLELANAPVFTMERSALLGATLGIADNLAEILLNAHPTFFTDQKLVEQLQTSLTPTDDLIMARAKMCAVALGQKDHSFSDLMRTLLAEYADEQNDGFSKLDKYQLTGFHWEGAKAIYGYASATPSIAGFTLWMFQHASAGFDSASSRQTRNLEIDFRSFRDSKKSSEAMRALARKAENDLGYRTTTAGLSLTDLLGTDVFEGTEREVIRRLVDGITSQTLSTRDILNTINSRRRESFWFDEYASLYQCIANAAELFAMIRSVKLSVGSFSEGLTQYRDEWFRIDRLYRTAVQSYEQAAYKQPLEALVDRIDAAYVTDFLTPLGIAWQQQVDTVERWWTPELKSQTSFYDNYISPLISGGHKKAVVVISDALRYEVAEELTTRLQGENKFSASIEAVLGVLPSYTQLGMASLLPHTTLGHSSEGDPVLVDGEKSNGTANRNKILSIVGGTAVQAKDFLALKPGERRDLYSAHQVLYIYHDTIDATGDKAVSEHRTFSAAADAITELIDIVKKLANANATNIFVTADHGFLYQRAKLEEQHKLTVKPHAEEIVASTRRYVLGRGFKEDPAFKTFTPQQLGLDSDLEVQIANSINRIVQPGAGFQFVHGGASLQEIVVPVVQINKKRSDTVEQVNIDIHPESDRITTGQIVVKLYQTTRVEPTRTARRLRAGLYFNDQLISNEPELIFDSTSAEGRDRFQSVTLLLSKDADAANGNTVEFRLSEPTDSVDYWKTYKTVPYAVKRAFANDDGWNF